MYICICRCIDASQLSYAMLQHTYIETYAEMLYSDVVLYPTNNKKII